MRTKLKIFLVNFLYFISCSVINAGNPEALFRDGYEALKGKNYQKAIEQFTGIEKQNMQSSELYKNMAFAYAGLNQNALAILYFEKAIKFKPNDPLLKEDLKKIRRRLPEIDEDFPPFFLIRYMNAFTGITGPDIWAAISLLLFLCTATIFIYFLPVPGLKIREWRLISVFTFLLVISALSAGYRFDQIFNNKGIIIINEGVSLKAGPDNLSPEVIPLPAGTKVFSRDKLDGWLMVDSQNGDTGWIKADNGKSI